MHLYKADIDYLVLDGIPRNVEQAKFISEFVTVEQVISRLGISPATAAIGGVTGALSPSAAANQHDNSKPPLACCDSTISRSFCA